MVSSAMNEAFGTKKTSSQRYVPETANCNQKDNTAEIIEV